MPRPYGLIGNEGSYGRQGFGDLPLCSSITTPPGWVGPVNCDPSQGPPYYPASQSQIADIWNYITSGDQITGNTPQTNISGWIKQNWVMLGLGVLGGMVLLGRRR